MKWLAILALILAFDLQASPFIVSDPTTQTVTHCGIFLDSAAKVESPVATETAGKYCKYDIASVTPGSHVIKATFINKDPVWGTLESVQSAPLSFVRPLSPAAAPSGLGLSP